MSTAPVVLIFGISGQDGHYLSRLLQQKSCRLHGTSRAGGASVSDVRHRLDPLDRQAVADLITALRPQEIYNLSGQSSVGLSFSRPYETCDSIITATLNILEAIRHHSPHSRFLNAGSSEIFGNHGANPASENTVFNPCSPYGIAKAASVQLTRCYRQAYGLHACSALLFPHESPLRTERFVTGKIIATARRIAGGAKERLVLGNIDIVRDWGWAPEYVEAMWRMLQQPHAQDYVIATGTGSALKDFVHLTFAEYGLDWREHVDHDSALIRPNDVPFSIGNPARASAELGWQATTSLQDIIRRMLAGA